MFCRIQLFLSFYSIHAHNLTHNHNFKFHLNTNDLQIQSLSSSWTMSITASCAFPFQQFTGNHSSTSPHLFSASTTQMLFFQYEEEPPKQESIKNCVFICTCLNFSHLQSTLHVMQYTYQGIFSTVQNSFWTLWFWCQLVLLPFFFVSLLPHWQNVSLWGCFSSTETKKKSLGERFGE